jgi:hypothetical protein
MTDIPILRAEKHWACPNCVVTAVTRIAKPHTEMHQCAGLSGILAPLVPAEETDRMRGARTQVRAIVRDDYEGKALTTRDDNGRPIMAVETVRPDGSTDRSVFADGINVRVVQ